MDFLLKLDEKVLAQFQRFADWWNERSPKNHFWLAKLLVWATVVTISVYYFSRLKEIWSMAISTVTYLMMGFALLYLLNHIEHLEKRADSTSRTAAGLPLNPDVRILTLVAMGLFAIIDARLFWLEPNIPNFFGWLIDPEIVFIYYLASCTSRPRLPDAVPARF